MSDTVFKWANDTPDKQPIVYQVGKNGVVAITDISVDEQDIWERGYRVELDDNTYFEIWNLPGIVWFKKD